MLQSPVPAGDGGGGGGGGGEAGSKATGETGRRDSNGCVMYNVSVYVIVVNEVRTGEHIGPHQN